MPLKKQAVTKRKDVSNNRATLLFEQEVTQTDKQGNDKGVFYNDQGKIIHTAWTFSKKNRVLDIYPYGYHRASKTLNFPKSIQTVQIKGWESYSAMPLTLRRNGKSPGLTPQLKDISKFFYKQDNSFKKLVIDRNITKSKITSKVVMLAFADYKDLMIRLKKLKDRTSSQRKNFLLNCCATIFTNYTTPERKLPAGFLAEYLRLYDSFDNLSQEDMDFVSKLLNNSSTRTILSSSFSLQTKNRLNIVFPEDVIKRFENLIRKSLIKESEWQQFFTKYTWVLNYIFPYQVLLYADQAYVGGKTLKNEEGRVVDYLFQNNLTDNFALVEIKLHTTRLLNESLYRKPSIYSITAELSGAMNQVLDQKDNLLKNYGEKNKIFNPKALLLAGTIGDLNEQERSCFENFRFNLKHVDIITFDEVLEKLKGLHKVLTSK